MKREMVRAAVSTGLELPAPPKVSSIRATWSTKRENRVIRARRDFDSWPSR